MYNVGGFNWKKNSQKISSNHGYKYKGGHVDLKIKLSSMLFIILFHLNLKWQETSHMQTYSLWSY